MEEYEKASLESEASVGVNFAAARAERKLRVRMDELRRETSWSTQDVPIGTER